MAKYEALRTFLLSQGKSVIQTTFAEIERVVGQPLPASAKYPAWWSNNPSNNSMTKVWQRAGFRTEKVDTVRKTLVFRRVPQNPPDPPMTAEQLREQNERVRTTVLGNLPTRLAHKEHIPAERGLSESGRTFSTVHHPLRGALKGHLRLVGGTDLTKPADPSWGDT